MSEFVVTPSGLEAALTVIGATRAEPVLTHLGIDETLIRSIRLRAREWALDLQDNYGHEPARSIGRTIADDYGDDAWRAVGAIANVLGSDQGDEFVWAVLLRRISLMETAPANSDPDTWAALRRTAKGHFREAPSTTVKGLIAGLEPDEWEVAKFRPDGLFDDLSAVDRGYSVLRARTELERELGPSGLADVARLLRSVAPDVGMSPDLV